MTYPKQVENSLVISAFPGCGKTTAYNHYKDNGDLKVWDSDSSEFPKEDFPNNYIEHIKKGIKEGVDIIFVSSHREVREALWRAGIKYALIYPNIELKNEYLKRYKERGNTPEFISLLDKNWHNWIMDFSYCPSNPKFELSSGEFINSDIIDWMLQFDKYNLESCRVINR